MMVQASLGLKLPYTGQAEGRRDTHGGGGGGGAVGWWTHLQLVLEVVFSP